MKLIALQCVQYGIADILFSSSSPCGAPRLIELQIFESWVSEKLVRTIWRLVGWLARSAVEIQCSLSTVRTLILFFFILVQRKESVEEGESRLLTMRVASSSVASFLHIPFIALSIAEPLKEATTTPGCVSTAATSSRHHEIFHPSTFFAFGVDMSSFLSR